MHFCDCALGVVDFFVEDVGDAAVDVDLGFSLALWLVWLVKWGRDLQVGFMGILMSFMTPYLLNISRMWSSLTLRVSASTTICKVLVRWNGQASLLTVSPGIHLTFALLGAGDPSLGVALRV